MSKGVLFVKTKWKDLVTSTLSYKLIILISVWITNNKLEILMEERLTLGKTKRKKAKWAAEGEEVRSQHWVSGDNSEQTLGDGGGQKSPECSRP